MPAPGAALCAVGAGASCPKPALKVPWKVEGKAGANTAGADEDDAALRCLLEQLNVSPAPTKEKGTKGARGSRAMEVGRWEFG